MMFREKEYVDISMGVVATLTRYAQIHVERDSAAMRWELGSEDSDLLLAQHAEELTNTIDAMQSSADVIWGFGQKETLDGIWDEATPVECDIASRWIETYRTALSFYMAEAEKEPLPEAATQEELDAYFYRRYECSSAWNGELFDLMAALPKRYWRMSWWVR